MHDLLQKLSAQAAQIDAAGAWPAEQFTWLAEAGVLQWVIPTEFAGRACTERELHSGYIDLAAACLTTTFILTQRNGACQRIAGSQNAGLKAELLPRLARGELFATVGISHLTTSRQHLRLPAVRVTRESGGFRFEGEVPWVTGGVHADFIVTGGALDDGLQVLAAIPTDFPGVVVQPAARMLALSASSTGPVQLDGVLVEEEYLIAGPVEQVMRQGASSTGSLGTSALATGLSRAALDHLAEEASRRPELLPILEPLRTECSDLASAIEDATVREAVAQNPALSSEAIRGRANSLVLRSTQALLAASKGAGFVSGHFAERAVREAMFFLVWSCPQPVVTAALRELAGLSSC
jgi:alkylation response protein AidB-like acyl-CoA dehydrogenase